ncbi:MAG: ABC transporter substrate-binding protein [Actinomycetota bacterium]|nr:ABC transporter substrate-binding protein [Actinomycetota bacterium]
MNSFRRWVVLLAVMAFVAMACAGQPTTQTTEAPGTTVAPGTTEADGTTTTAETGALASVSAESCDYGGKIQSIEATDPMTVVFTMCAPVPAFQQIVAFTPFAIQPAEHLEATGGAPLDNPIGTGPFVLEAWNRGSDIVFQRNDEYWGEPPAFQTLVFRWATESATRLLELQSGNVHQITTLGPDDIPTVEGDPNLQLLPDLNPNIFYLGMSNFHEPFDQVEVRQAIAMGIDRQQIVDNFYPPGSEVPTHFTPCSIENGCQGEEWYEFDPDTARQMLEDAGVAGFDVTITYRDVFRVYLPEPGAVANEIAQQLNENLGINATVQVVESGEMIASSTAGDDPMYLLGWGADYPHVTNFLDFHFGEANPQFGETHPEIYEPLVEASSIADPEEAAPLYEEANNAIKELVPMVPMVWGAAADAALASLEGAHTPNFGAPQFERMDPGEDTLVFMQNAEPISLYCADETDGESLSACQQVVEPLLGYDLEGNVIPKLATECTANEDSTVWTCTLREGVTFHDGSEFDAQDVIASWAAGIDAGNPLHVGNTGAFEYYTYLWDQLMNAPEE